MPYVRFKLDPDNPPRMTPEEKARLDAMTDEEITAAALSDPDNPPLTDEELAWMATTLDARRAREKLGLTQEQFAERYQIDVRRLRDLELGLTVREDTALVAYLKVIEREPEAVARALGLSAA